MSGYTLADLQDVDERCRQIADEELGFDVPEVIYHLVAPEEVYFAAANGLPARYSSARWGAQFDDAYGRYQRGQERIYELIFNTRPVHAYLMDGNSLVAQTLVIAHCLGHGYVFENNQWLGAVDREIMSRVISAAERIADYMGAYGRDRVEDFLDSCHAIAIHQPQAQLIRRAAAREPEHRSRPYDALFPEEVSADRERVAEQRTALRSRFPREPEQDLLSFIEANARGLEDWQRDVISIVHTEQSYFLPQMRTKILNEGAAVLLHQEVCQRLFLPTDRYLEYEQLNSVVMSPHPARVNPYNIGIHILREIMRIAAEPDDEERELWRWAGEVEPLRSGAQRARRLRRRGTPARVPHAEGVRAVTALRVRAPRAGPAPDPRLLARGRRDPGRPGRPAFDARDPARGDRRRRLSRAWRAVDRPHSRRHRTRRGVRPGDAFAGRDAVGQALHGEDHQRARDRSGHVVHGSPRRPLGAARHSAAVAAARWARANTHDRSAR